MQHQRTGQPTALVTPTALRNHASREGYVRRYAWAIPSEEALAVIAEVSHRRVVEVGAGGGYWAQLLRDRSWGGVRKAPASIARDYPERTLMLCWPPYRDPMAREALASYQGDTLVFIGELTNSWNGIPNVADDEFFELLRSGWRMVREVSIPQWGVPFDGMEDTLSVWRRREARQSRSVVGPGKERLLRSLSDAKPRPVVFTSEWDGPIRVFVLSLEREDGSGDCWNVQARVAGENRYVRGFYNTRTRRGSFRPVGS